MALTPDEKSYLDRLKAAWANKESMTELLEKRRAKEKAMKPWIIWQGIQTLQNIGGGAIQAGWELAVGLPWQISRLLPGDQSADPNSFYNKTQRLLESTKQDMTKQGIQTDSTAYWAGKFIMNTAWASILSGWMGNLAGKSKLLTQLGLKVPTWLAGETAVWAIKWAKEWLSFDLASGNAPWVGTAGGAIIWGAIPWVSQAAGAFGRYMSKIPTNPAINQSKVWAYTEWAIKEWLNTAKKMAKDIIAPYTSKIDETSGIMSAIKPKQIVKNGAVTRSQEQITKEIELANNMIRKAWLKPKSIAEYNTAIKTNMQKLGSEIESKTKQKLYVNLTDTATKLKNLANSPAIQRLDPAGAKELKNMAARMRIKQWFLKVEDAEMMNQIINDTLRNPATASETTKRGFQIIVWDLRDKLDEAVSKIPWEFKELKKAYWALRNVYRDGISREIVYNRANPEGLISSYSKIEWWSDFMSGIMKMAGLDVKGGIADIAKWLTKNKLWQVIKTKNDPNYIINKIFNGDTPTLP